MNIQDISKNSSLLLVGGILASSSYIYSTSNDCSSIPRYKYVQCSEIDTISLTRNYESKSYYKEAKELFGEVRGFTEIEAAQYKDSIESLLVETGGNFFDL